MTPMPKSPLNRRPFTERISTALLFLVLVFAVGMGVGALIGKFHPPTPVAATTAPVGAHKPGATTDPTKFASGDRIEITFTGIAGPGITTTKTYTVDEKGLIPIPLLGNLEVRGYTASQTEQAIAQGYRDQNLVSNMPVKVTRLTGASTAPAK
jgi:protein involved in polysaccharide export with SLBB domain